MAQPLFKRRLAFIDLAIKARRKAGLKYEGLESLRNAVLEAEAYSNLVNTLARKCKLADWQRDQMKESSIDAVVTLTVKW